MKRPRPRSRAVPALASVLAVLALVAGCASGGDGNSSSSSASNGSTSDVGATARRAPAEPAGLAAADGSAGGTAADRGGTAADRATDAGADDVVQRSVIAKGSLELSTGSVDEVRRRARTVVTTAGGVIAEEQTDSDRHGRARTVDLVLRVPVARFDHVLDALAGLGRLEHRSQSAEDVTTQVIDVGARVRAQRASVASIERLYARATTIGEVMSIEAQLAKRQAALDSLERQQKYLADQTALGTIQLTITRTPGTKPPVATAGGHGFVGGLEAGWHALTTVGRGLAVVLGAVLPWLLLLGAVAVPVRFLRRRRSIPAGPSEG
jgi:hypothetical protein